MCFLRISRSRRKTELPKYNLSILETIVYIEDQDAILTILQDVTEDEKIWKRNMI